MDILALDVATKTGWASNSGKVLRSGITSFAIKRGESPGMRFLRCRSWLEEVYGLLNKKVNVIVYEQAQHRGGAATMVCVGLVTEVQAFASKYNIEMMPVHTGTLKKFSTGNGRASKKDMVKAAKKKGWKPEDHNEADAQLLLEYAMYELNVKKRREIKRRKKIRKIKRREK